MRSGLILFFIILAGIFLRIYRITPSTAVFDVFVLIGILGGLAGITAVFLFSREMFNQEIGLLSAFLTSISSWHIAVSRESVWPNWFLFFFTLFLYFLWKGLRGSHKCNFIFSGIFLGLVLYLSFPFFIPLTIIGMKKGKLKVGKVNVDENPNTAAQFGIMSIPSILIFKNGEPVKTMIGAQSKENFKKGIEEIIG